MFHAARRSYSQVQQAALPDVADPHEVIGVTLRELARALRALASAKDSGAPYPSDPMRKAFTAIYILQSSLDFEKGGEIAPSLFRVYEFCRIQVAQAFRREEADLATAAVIIDDLHGTWLQIGENATTLAAE